MNDYKKNWIQKLQEMYPDLWLFFEGEESYKNDAKDDLNCKRWKDTLEIAYFAALRDSEKVTCKPREIVFETSEEYTDHHSDDGVEFRLNRVKKITKEEYIALQEKRDDADENSNRWLRSCFLNIFYLKDDIFKEYILLRHIKYNSLYSDQLAILAQIKDVEGYFLFEFNR